MLKQDFANCAPKNGKTDPDAWFNELDDHKIRLGIMGSGISDEDMITHLMRKVSLKEYKSVVAYVQTMMRMNLARVTVENLKGAIRDRYKYMKLSGAIKKEPDEAFFTKNFKGTCNKCGKQGHKGTDCWSKKGSEDKEGAGTDKRLCFKCKKAGHSRNTVLSP